jgi:hypothetical protein
MVNHLSRAESYYARSMLRAKATKWLDSSHIVGWLEDRKIVELLFGKGVHFELISRSKDILRVLSEFRRYASFCFRNGNETISFHFI